MGVSRFKVIRRLVRKEYGSVRPTSQQIIGVIKKYDLSLYKTDGKKRNREVIGRALAKALNSLK